MHTTTIILIIHYYVDTHQNILSLHPLSFNVHVPLFACLVLATGHAVK